ncbi:TPR-like protein [Cylindrobasidium torrendii FP15055 ss-10]|uniref:TPR-like protein n=1 Tax=Cylindrobasidium torrendii FP15055 ss-10 TaxID=1314674 RepID=A0A0D7B1X2_9AGAR|nr:TPR-like protein [Cylindrobasidium torrendii FP15055 ss-10]
MVSKKTKEARRAAKQADSTASPTDSKMNGTASGSNASAADDDDGHSEVEDSQPPPEPEDPAVRAERLKEQGNGAFKAQRYAEAVRLYSEAIELNPSEPAYRTNRAASYMSLKKFRKALDDCQQAAGMQSATPSPKTLLRLARCQAALGLATPALSTLSTIQPQDAAVTQLQKKINELQSHLANFEAARQRKEWPMARLSLDKCIQSIDADGEEVPSEWRLWRVEIELAKGNWEGANQAASDALRLNPNSPEILSLRGLVMFIEGKLSTAATHAANALRLDPSYTPAMRLRRRVKDVERLKDEGNAYFKSGNLQGALDKYGEALDIVGSAEEEGKGGQIRATLLSNRATTLVKLSQHEDALKDIEASIELSGRAFKPYRTRARINLHLERYESAVQDFKSAIQYAQDDVGVSSERDIRELRSELKKAEAALKRSKSKDYYKILGLARDCDSSEIKKAYRRESLRHHPDKGGDEEKFKLVVEAHTVLSDPQRRERYDLGEDEDGMNEGGHGGFGGGMGGMSEADLANIFAQFSGGPFSGGGGFGGGRRGGSGFGGHSHGFAF